MEKFIIFSASISLVKFDWNIETDFHILYSDHLANPILLLYKIVFPQEPLICTTMKFPEASILFHLWEFPSLTCFSLAELAVAVN